jgi:hypothetical protein
MSIALPVELKRQMDAVPNVIRPNWSALLRPRIEAEIVKLKRERSDQTAAIGRLRALRLQQERENLIQGWADGRNWAENRGDYRVLRRLERSVRRSGNLRERPWECLRAVVDRAGEYTDEFLCEHLFKDPDCDSLDFPTYVTAFIEGALESWREMASEVEAENATKDYLLAPDQHTESYAAPEEPSEGQPTHRKRWRPIAAVTRAAETAGEWLAKTFPVDYR